MLEECPCKNCKLRTQDCHCAGKCKSTTNTYGEWKTQQDELKEIERQSKPLVPLSTEKALKKFSKGGDHLQGRRQ